MTKVNEQKQPVKQLNVARELLDVTWRIATPVLIFAGIGIVIDRAIGSQPWMTLLGTMVGLLFASQLIKRQINRGDNR